jgi:hypothetical protein
VAPGRAFVRLLSFLTYNLTEPWHKVRLSQGAKQDLHIWLSFLDEYIGVSFFRDIEWKPNIGLKLFNNASKCGFVIMFGKHWNFSEWPSYCKYTTGIQLMEMFPVAVALYMWGHLLQHKKLVFYCDNLRIVHAINHSSAKCPKMMDIIRFIVLKSLQYNLIIKMEHLAGINNTYCDQLSRGQIQAFKEGCTQVNNEPDTIPQSVWKI